MEVSEERLKTINKIKELESSGLFNNDVEDDPPTKPLLPGKVDYLNKRLSSKIGTAISNRMATKFFDKRIKEKQLIIDGVEGYENLRDLDCGAIITCNHFNPNDNYAVFKVMQKDLDAKKTHLYKVIREGNYTNFKGIYGYFFRHCNTLPLSSSSETMRDFLHAMSVLLKRGEKILVYPEQSMWWNYRKPRPLKPGAFNFAVKNNSPIVPCFITMEDSELLDENNYPVQKYTLHFDKPIFPKSELSAKENINFLMENNYNIWKEIYERVYKTKLIYK